MFSNLVKATFNDLDITNRVFCQIPNCFGEIQKNICTLKKNRKRIKRFYIPRVDGMLLGAPMNTKLKWLSEFAKEKKIGIVTTCDLGNLPIDYSLYYRGRVSYSPLIPKLKNKVKYVDQINFLVKPKDFGIRSLEDGVDTKGITLFVTQQAVGKIQNYNSISYARL